MLAAFARLREIFATTSALLRAREPTTPFTGPAPQTAGDPPWNTDQRFASPRGPCSCFWRPAAVAARTPPHLRRLRRRRPSTGTKWPGIKATGS